MAGDLSNTTIFEPNNAEAIEKVKAMFKEQVIWAREEGADYIVTETFNTYEESALALEAVKEYGQGSHCSITCGLCHHPRIPNLPDLQGQNNRYVCLCQL
ncbi:unnamed protein product [Acanthosepion pharaonis]|uniref:Uncharacterized protein n=1 Tax=Acanthosepion pharaonis TaxID=158019 RepID=A0A812DPT3_ACAPH|nr:unnamed protein product [Sepia pharaonis]